MLLSTGDHDVAPFLKLGAHQSSTESCGPRSASMPATWVKLAVQEFEFVIRRATCSCEVSAHDYAVTHPPTGHGVSLWKNRRAKCSVPSSQRAT